MSKFIKTFRKAKKLIASKQNRENSIALLGVDADGNQWFLQWIEDTTRVDQLQIPSDMVSIHAQAGTCYV